MNKGKLIVIVGPTAVGKTSTSIFLAHQLNGEVVSADSRYFYRGMDIGTAKPYEEEIEGVPHHLIDVANPDENWSLALFQRKAYQAIDEIHSRGKVPILVGGTGQYVEAITDGWQIPKQRADEALREELNRWAEEVGTEGLHQRLAVLDPQAASNIDHRNVRRTIRALEVIFLTGKKFSDQRMKKDPRYEICRIGLNRPREELYQHIDQRIELMMEMGLVKEVKELLKKGYAHDLPAFSAIGYREIIQYLRGEISKDEAVMLIKRNTRKFVRRQSNWFKLEDPMIRWFEMGEEQTTQQILAYVQEFLQS